MVEEEFLLVKNTNGRSMHMFMTRTKTKALAMLLVLAMVIAIVPVAASANYTPTVISNVSAGFGDPNKPATAPECFISLTYDSDSGKYNASYSDSIATSYFPGEVALYAAPGTGFSGTLTLVASNSSIWFETYDQYGEATTHSSITYASNSNWNRDNNQYELSYLFATKMTAAGDVYVKDGSGDNATTLFTIHFPGPLPYTMPGATSTPTGFEGYLPVGQFATGTGWGSPYSSGTTPKIVGGYTSTGLSLGAAGGYAEYDMVINNFDTNGNKIQRPYGVDFIVYGNAFINNPEAGSVKVYGVENKTGATYQWYELAGSLYYGDDIEYEDENHVIHHRNVTLRDVTVTYKKVTSTDSTFNSTGIWYKVTKGTSTIIDWTKFSANTNWWPEESEGYLGTNGFYGPVNDVVVDMNANTIAYQHVTIVRDTDTTPDYAFGYFDITPNGSSYGTAVNPYVYGTTGANGFDLDWAVDNNGTPVELTTISKIRVYSSAGMKASGASNIFTTPAVFGETSAELCGIYAASGTATNGPTSAPTITLGGSDITQEQDVVVTSSGNVTFYDATALGYAASSVSIGATPATGTTANIFINENSTESYTKPTSVSMVRVIAQTGDGAPYIAVIKF